MSERFNRSANSAHAFLSHLLGQADHDTGGIAAPQMLEMLTLCRETNLRLPILEAFSKASDERPVMTLLGGDAAMAVDFAHCMGIKAELCDVPETPIMWWVEPSRTPRTTVLFGATERELSEAALNALLTTALPPDRVTVLRREIQSDAQWRFAWLPDAQALALHSGSLSILEAMVGAQVMVFIGDEIPGAFHGWFSRPGMVARQLAATEIVRDDIRPQLFSELYAMREQSYEEREAVHAATWQFIMPRLVDQLDSLRQQYTIEIDRQNMRLQTTRQTLGEYRRNWSNGIRNVLDDFFSKKSSGPAVAALLDPRQPGPQTSTYLQALSLPSLWKPLHELLTERLGEFVQGLGALAVRVELRTISLKEVEMRWNPAGLVQQIEEELAQKRVFSEGGGERSGLVGSLTGKKEEISSARRAQITRANKTVQQLIEQDFLQWTDKMLHAVEQRVRLQIAAGQANLGLPDIEALRTGLTGIDRLTALLEGDREVTRQEPSKRASQLLRGWSQRRWFRRYVPAA
ncbi:MAG: hypothetical protein IPP40_16855 [bacterium]|nr:hypothetical protein [bacterium]